MEEQERELSLKEAFWYILKGWKAMIVGILIGALLLSGYSYYKASKSNAADDDIEGIEEPTTVSVAPDSTEETETVDKKEITEQYIDSLMADMTYEEKLALNRAMDSYKDYRSAVEKYENDYILNMDANDVYRISCKYYFDIHYIADYANGVSPDYTQSAMEAVRTVLTNSESKNYLVSKVEGILTTDDLDSLVTYEYSGNYFTVTVRSAKQETSETILAGINELFTSASEVAANTVGTFDSALVSTSTYFGYDSTVANTKTSYNQTIDAAINNKNNYEAALTDAERKIYNKYKSKYEEIKEVEKEPETVAEGETTVAATTSASEEKTSTTSGFDKKKALIGGLLGLIVVIAIYFCKFAFSKTIKNVDDIKQITRSFNFGLLFTKGDVFDRKRLSVKNTSLEEMIVYIANSITTYCSKEGIKEIFITGTSAKQDEEVVNKIIEALEKSGIKASLGASLTVDTEALQKAVDAPAVLLVEKIDCSVRDDVIAESNIIHKNDIKTIGNVVVF